MMSLDPTTRAAYNAEPTANGRANVVLSSLGSTVAVVVYDGPGNIMGSGMMQGTWATVAANVLTIGEVANFDVLADGTPDAASWYIRFEGAGRWARAPFGPTGDFTWSQSAFITGNTGTIGNASAAVPVEVVRTDLALAWDVAAGTVVVTFGWKATTDLTLPTTLLGTAATYDLAQEANLLGQPANFTLQPPLVTGVSIDQATGLLTKASGVVVNPGHEILVDLVQNVGSLEQDWINRSTGPGVKWAHDFRTQREVDQFRVSDDVRPFATSHAGNDPNSLGINTTYWEQGDGMGLSKCLRTVAPDGNNPGGTNMQFPASSYWANISSSESRVTFPAGTTYTPITTNPTKGTFTFPGGSIYVYECKYRGGSYFDPTNTTAYFSGEHLKFERRVNAGGWIRPFSALIAGNTGNGKTSPDAGSPKRTYDVSNNQAFGYFRYGHYGPADLHVTKVLAQQTIQPQDWDGTEYYVQFRVKFSTGRHAKRTPPAGSSGSGADVSVWLATGQEVEYKPPGKLAFIQPGPEQIDNYVILQSGQSQRYAYQTCPLRMYSARGMITMSDPQNQAGPLVYYQNVGPYAPTCNSQHNVWEAGKCWEWPENEWVTVLFYCRPGHDNYAYIGGFGIVAASVVNSTRINVTLNRPLPANAAAVLPVGGKLNFSTAFAGTWAPLSYTNAYIASVTDPTHLVLDTSIDVSGFGAYTSGGGFYFDQSAWPFQDHGIKVWVARANATAYTAIYDKMNHAFYCGDGNFTPGGSHHNIDFSCYMNNMPSWGQFEHRYTQVIFGDQFIPCPAVALT